MEKISALLFCFLILLSQKAAGQASLYTDLVGYWKLDESSGNALDAFGNNPGTITGATVGQTGKLNTCYSFDGSDYITIGNGSVFNFGSADFSISAWIKTTSTKNQVIISKYYDIQTAPGYVIGMNNGLPYATLQGTSGSEVTATGECEYNDGLWHRITAIFDRDGYLTLYVDLDVEASVNISSLYAITNTYNLYIGRLAPNTTKCFVGSIDEVAIWNRTLTDLEVAGYLYNNGSGVSFPFGYIPVTGITVSPTSSTIGVGTTTQLTATISPATASDKTVTWTSSETDFATVSSSGLVTGIDVGPSTITVTTKSGSKTAACSVTVIIPVTGVTMSPTTASVEKGSTTQLTSIVSPSNATNTSVTWNSSNTSVATVSSSGLVTAVGAGIATITVTTNNNSKTATCAVTVTVPVTGITIAPTSVSVERGSTTQLTATISPSNATDKTVTWSSSNTSVVTVSSSGFVTAVSAGTATITVTTTNHAKTATCAATVTIPVTGVTISSTAVSVEKGSTTQLTATISPSNATDKTVTWSSSNTSVATVSPSGLVTGVAAGTATITVTTTNHAKTATCAATVKISLTGVTIAPSTVSVEKGATTQLVATVLPSDATNKAVTWTSSNTSIATVSSSGVVTGVGAGTATITVTTSDGNKTCSCTVTVIIPVTGVSLSSKASVLVNKVVQLRSTLIPSDATNQNVTWTSANSTIATVNATGLVSGIAPGTASIIVTTSDGSKKDTCAVTVLSSSSNWLNNGDDIYYSSGNVGIGIDSAVKTLTVNGKILAERITVVSSITSDYVFEPDYKLMPIHELEAYIKQHKHLPGVPSAAEFAKQGQNLGKMDDLLLRKIEELTLYVIDLKKEYQKLKMRLDKIERNRQK